jgi:hypothetical protein
MAPVGRIVVAGDGTVTRGTATEEPSTS